MPAVQPVAIDRFFVAPKAAVTQGAARDNMMKKIFLSLIIAAGAAAPAASETVSKSYSYFGVGGTTFEQIENDLFKRGPHVKSTGLRHPGATRMNFTTRIGYANDGRHCRIVSADTTVKASIVLPKWRQRSRANTEVRIFWDTLFADIKRHEERHVEIAKAHARELEQALRKPARYRTCEEAAARAREISARVLAKHDRAQIEFDRVEGINFENRLLRLLLYRIERQDKAGRQS